MLVDAIAAKRSHHQSKLNEACCSTQLKLWGIHEKSKRRTLAHRVHRDDFLNRPVTTKLDKVPNPPRLQTIQYLKASLKRLSKETQEGLDEERAASYPKV